jgi:hypothetical protein
VLKHSSCAVQVLILANVSDGTDTSYEFDLLPAIAGCRSLRCVALLGGYFRRSFLCGMLSDIQTENPRIKEVYIEDVAECNFSSESVSLLANSGGRLLCDYFNYSLPGLHTLCLHSCCLKDADLELLLQGVEVNSSIKSLFLSKNMITDVGCVSLLASIAGNRKSNMNLLDLSYNLVALRSAATDALHRYVHPQPAHTLQLYLAHNFVLRKHDFKHAYKKLEVRVHLGIGGRTSRKILVQSSGYVVAHAERLLDHHHRHHHHHHHHRHHHHHHHEHHHQRQLTSAQVKPHTAGPDNLREPLKSAGSSETAGQTHRPVTHPSSSAHIVGPVHDDQNRRSDSKAPAPLTHIPKRVFIPISGAIPTIMTETTMTSHSVRKVSPHSTADRGTDPPPSSRLQSRAQRRFSGENADMKPKSPQGFNKADLSDSDCEKVDENSDDDDDESDNDEEDDPLEGEAGSQLNDSQYGSGSDNDSSDSETTNTHSQSQSQSNSATSAQSASQVLSDSQKQQLNGAVGGDKHLSSRLTRNLKSMRSAYGEPAAPRESSGGTKLTGPSHTRPSRQSALVPTPSTNQPVFTPSRVSMVSQKRATMVRKPISLPNL